MFWCRWEVRTDCLEANEVQVSGSIGIEVLRG
jgi:hypothetical protein